MHRFFSPFAYAFMIFILFIILTGCQRSPILPGPGDDPGLSASSQTAACSHQCLGYYLIEVDSKSYGIEVHPLRSAEWHFNLAGIMNTTMGVSAAGVPSEHDPANGLFVFDITLAHPFGTSPQFTGFDVKGILVTPGTYAVGSLVYAGADETRLENADGYSRWWNPTEFSSPGMLGYEDGILASAPGSELTATINPYKLFADILYPTSNLGSVCYEPLDSDQGRAVFTAGSSNTRRYEIRFPMDPGPQIVYGYAIDCAWNPPSPNPPGEVPDDFPMNANQPEAYRIALKTTANTLYYDSESGIGGGVLRLQMNVHDWQGQAVGNIVPEIDAVRIVAPDLMPSGVDGILHEQTPEKAIYTVDLTGTAVPSEAGETMVICRVASSDGSTYQQAGAPAPDTQISAFHVITLDIPDPECAGDANNGFGEAVEIDFGESIADQVCLPNDNADYFSFTVPEGYGVMGEIQIYSDAGPTCLTLFDGTESQIASECPFEGLEAIELGGLNLMHGLYYLRVSSNLPEGVRPYLLELRAELVDITPSNPVDVTPSTLYCEPEQVWLHGDNAYLLGANGYWVHNISNPANPVQLSHEEIWHGKRGCFHYPYCYYIVYISPDESQINLIDFTDPASPVLHDDVLHFSCELGSLCMNSTHLYVGTSVNPTSMVRIFMYGSDPQNPIEVGYFNVPYYPKRLTLMDSEGPDTHLVAIIDQDIRSFDVEDPLWVDPAGTYSFTNGHPNDITTWDDFIFIAHNNWGADGWLYVLEQTSVPSVVEVGSLDIPAGPACAFSIAHQSPYVYIGTGESGFTICDVSTPNAPSHVVTCPDVQDGHDLDISGDTLCVIPDQLGMCMFDVSNVLEPELEHCLDVMNSPCEAQVTGDYLLVVDSSISRFSVKTIDISDPPNAEIVAEWVATPRLSYMWLDNDRLAVAGTYDWYLLDASDPLNLTLEHSDSEINTIRAIAIWGNALYISMEFPDSVAVYNITNPSSPVFETLFFPTSAGTDFSFHAGYMYISTVGGIEIYELSDPYNPFHTNTYSLLGVYESSICWDMLYMVTHNSLEIADLSSPTAPSFLGSVTITGPEPVYELAVTGYYAYLAGEVVPQIISAWPPDSPSLFGTVYDYPPYMVNDLLVHEGYLYEVSHDRGLHIFDLY